MKKSHKIIIECLKKLEELEKKRELKKNIKKEKKIRHDDLLDHDDEPLDDELIVPINDDIFDRKEIGCKIITNVDAAIRYFPNALLIADPVTVEASNLNEKISTKVNGPEKNNKNKKTMKKF